MHSGKSAKKLNRKLFLVIAVVLVLAVTIACLAWSDINTFRIPEGVYVLKPDQSPDKTGKWLQAQRLNYTPNPYFELKNADKYTLTAVNLPGYHVYVTPGDKETFTEQMLNATLKYYGTLRDVDEIYEFLWQGQYYTMKILFKDLPFETGNTTGNNP